MPWKPIPAVEKPIEWTEIRTGAEWSIEHKAIGYLEECDAWKRLRQEQVGDFAARTRAGQ